MAARRVDRVERLTNLLALLLETTRPLSMVEIAGELDGQYPDDERNLRAAFERDKAALRDLGVPIETVLSPEGEAEGYRLVAKEFYLPYLSMVVEGRKTAPNRVDRYGYKALAGLADLFKN